jgi:hypothetical protein
VEILLLLAVFLFNAVMTLFWPLSPDRYAVMMLLKFTFASGNLVCSLAFLIKLKSEKLNVVSGWLGGGQPVVFELGFFGLEQ